MAQYLALLRGVNVGGNNMVKMASLKVALENDGFSDVKTYIQSGNVFVSTPERSKLKVARSIAQTIANAFALDIEVVVFTKSDWKKVVESAPTWWGGDADWKHDLLILLPPAGANDLVSALAGDLKPEIEQLEIGRGVVYSSLLIAKYGRTRMSRMVGTPIYKQMTIRNYNTANKLLHLFK